ncbi:hypothetical protein K2173_021831 [Erythroxylum novogranatense]|uniref:Transcription factor IIIC 90kDa subunit N-terminal domain-containing protein n=1 Tax=Erythroxylum novogranatense TaxID=1862640 RepID=A0AAV8T3I9_9ROSI|nr:hypothetical protein K2173_021831 [Erythroxylum novogranatense]
MASRFQAAALVAAPSFPNALAWSDENLIAVASGHVVTILNPAMPFGARGLIRLPADTQPYPIGRVTREDLLTGCLLPISLSRDRRPCARSISWSPIGMSPNSGCLLAVCTTEGRVKLYRQPFCDFCAEWIEVTDLSDKLYNYLTSRNFGELDSLSPEFANDEVAQGCADSLLQSCNNDLTNSSTRKERKRRRAVVRGDISEESEACVLLPTRNGEKDSLTSFHQTKMENRRLIKDYSTCALITADKYASRSAMLSSLVVAWSPLLRFSSKNQTVPLDVSSHIFSILVAGGKSGKISVWRIHAPEYFSVEHVENPTSVILVGLLQAHNSWTTAISLVLLASSSDPRLLLASGSSDGSVKIWMSNAEQLLESSEANSAPFVLLREVIAINSIPVSVLSIAVPAESPCKIHLAVGKGSGSFEVWTSDLSGCQFDNAGAYDAHDCIVTGLAWAFDGCCLYSSGQDNYVRCWVFRGDSLCEVPIPSNIPGLRTSTDLPDIFLSCLGVAVSPGNLVLAMVRNLDIDQLNPMYQARAQKAVVEFFWIGGQQDHALLDTSLDCSKEAFLGFQANELLHWESNILWSLKKFENPEKPLVIWDVMAALSAVRHLIPIYIDHILCKWLLVTFIGSKVNLSLDEVLLHIPQTFSLVTSRQLHLLNIICRRVILSELKPEEINCQVNLEPVSAESERFRLWMKLLFSSEHELRERLVGLSFSAFKNLISHPAKTSTKSGCWSPVGIAQMEQWVARNHADGRHQLKAIVSEILRDERRFNLSGYVAEEHCNYCSTMVPFDSPEVAFCEGTQSDGTVQKHKSARCAVSMQVCPITPIWFCKCCHRWSSKLAPETFFTLPEYTLDIRGETEVSDSEELSKPLCPFCGILLQRYEPEFLLSASPV